MPKTLMQNVVEQLETERIHLETELHKISAALEAFGRPHADPPQLLSWTYPSKLFAMLSHSASIDSRQTGLPARPYQYSALL